jgi:hypothetical protein
MTGIVWAAILIGLALVIAAVGIPYLLTHKRMRSPHDHAESQEYLQKTHGRVQRDGTISAKPGPAPRDPGTSPSPPATDRRGN